MIVPTLCAMAVALTAIAWTTAYAWTDTIPALMWLDRVRRLDAWWDTIDAMHVTLAALGSEQLGDGEELSAWRLEDLAALGVGHPVEVTGHGQEHAVVLCAGEDRLSEGLAFEFHGEFHAVKPSVSELTPRWRVLLDADS